MLDAQQRLALQYGKAILARMDAGSTLGQAVNQAYADVNPNGSKKIRAAIVASLVGVDLSDVPLLARYLLRDREDAATTGTGSTVVDPSPVPITTTPEGPTEG